MISKIKEIAVPFAVLTAAALYFGVIGSGKNTPEMLKPKA